jgi:cytochrome P450
MLDATQAITLDVIARVLFGVEDEARLAETRSAVRALIASIHPGFVIFPFLRHEFGGVGPWAKNMRAVRALDGILAREMDERRRADSGREDASVLSILVRAETPEGDAAVRDQLRGLLFAGHETTATVLAWALYCIHDEPDLLARLVAELDAVPDDAPADADASLPLLEATCFEALRLYPPVVEPSRVTRAPFTLGRYVVPAGEAVRASPMLLHTREDLYPDPDRFRPERFLERRFGACEFIPFGGGTRRCLGAAFATFEMKIVLGAALRAFRFRLTDAPPPRHARRGLTLGPSGGVPMVFEGSRTLPPRERARPAEPCQRGSAAHSQYP